MRVNPSTPWSVVTTYSSRASIVMRPDYQRQLVWTTAQKQLLIDSILSGFDIPKFYFRKTSSSPDVFDVVAEWFVDFEHRRDLDEQKEPEQQSLELISYHEKTAHSTDAYDSLNFRNTFLMTDLFTHVPHLRAQDSRRLFDEVQKRIIFRRDNAICKMCGKVCEWDEFQADHIVPWSKGGQTEIENGQVLCAECNFKKGATM